LKKIGLYIHKGAITNCVRMNCNRTHSVRSRVGAECVNIKCTGTTYVRTEDIEPKNTAKNCFRVKLTRLKAVRQSKSETYGLLPIVATVSW
jgi:hypothetical protein